MLNIFGKHLIEPKALNQMYNATKEDWIHKAALMPDAHLGYSLPIGGVVVTDQKVVPAWVGYDIGCGVCAVEVHCDPDWIRANQDYIFDEIYRSVPMGYNHKTSGGTWDEYTTLPATTWLSDMFQAKGGLKQLGTLGNGNHFIEIGEDEQQNIRLIIHSGSRNVGYTVAQHYMIGASVKHTGIAKAKEGNFEFDVCSPEGMDYLMDMEFCLSFALENRVQMLESIEKIFQALDKEVHLIWPTLINKTHNHVEYDDVLEGWVHRKGATQAHEGEMGVIPGNMRDGCFIVRGKGNKKGLFSSSHGAGRTCSRKEAKTLLGIEEFRTEMEGIKAKVSNGVLDENPYAYKEFDVVMAAQQELVDIVTYVQPIINIKG